MSAFVLRDAEIGDGIEYVAMREETANAQRQ